MLISVAICTYERYQRLAGCLASLQAQTLPPEQLEILVLDNSPDAALSAQMAAQHAALASLRWIHIARTGLAHARNHAMQEAQAPLLAFIDDDVTVAPGWSAALVAGFKQFGEAIHSAGGPVHPEWSAPPPAWLAADMLPFLSLMDRGGEARLLAHEEWVPGANVAYRLARLRAAGGFAEALGRNGPDDILLSNEETELGHRLHRGGGRTAWLPDAVATHRIDPSRLDRVWFRRRFAWQAVSDYLVNPEHQRRYAPRSWKEAQGFMAHMDLAGLDALRLDQERPDLCHWQMSAIYHLMLCLLGGLDQVAPPADGHG